MRALGEGKFLLIYLHAPDHQVRGRAVAGCKCNGCPNHQVRVAGVGVGSDWATSAVADPGHLLGGLADANVWRRWWPARRMRARSCGAAGAPLPRVLHGRWLL